MSTLINDPILDAIREGISRFPLGIGGFLVVALALLLVFLKEVARARNGTRVQAWMEAADIAILPLMGAAGVVILAHLLNIVRP